MRSLFLALLPLGLAAQSTTVVDNARVRILNAMDPPHRKTALHKHDVNRVMIYLDTSDQDISHPDAPTEHFHWKAGDVAWSPAGGMHVSENVGSGNLRIVEIEIKQPAPAALPKRARNLDRHHRLVDVEFGRAAQVFFVVLFVLTGATLHPDQLGAVAWIGLAFVIARALGKAAALYALAWPAHISASQAGTLSLTLTPIAGLALGMTQPIYDIAPEFGARLAAIVISGVAILQLLGPIATRYALIRAGEGEPRARD